MDSRHNLMTGIWKHLAFWLAIASVFFSCRTAAQTPISVSGRVPVRVATPAGTLPTGTSQALLDLATHAGVIFAGQVLAITPGAGFVEIRFRIDQPLRGCPNTDSYVLREWAGLWTSHPDRYRLGQRLLMLLTTPGPSGISAPVNTIDGAIPLVASNPQPIVDPSGAIPPDTLAPAALTVDLRWLQTRISRASESSPASTLLGTPRAASVSTQAPANIWTGPTSPLAEPPTPTLTSVLFLLANGASSAAR